VQGDDKGLVAQRIKGDSISLTTTPHASREKGVGWMPNGGADWSGSALCRGGCWRSVVYAGVFILNRGWPNGEYDHVGFRCTKRL
jgi:hypothetical protein